MAQFSRVPDLAVLELLDAVSRHGSVVAAGRELGLTPQAVTGRLRAWESRSGTALLERGRRGGRLSPQGTLLARWAGPLLAGARDLDTALAALRGTGGLGVAATDTVAEHLLPGWLVRMRDESAGPVDLAVLDSPEVLRSVLDGAATLGFLETPGLLRGTDLPAGLRSATVASDRLVLVVHPEHEWAVPGTVVDRAELAGARPATSGADVRAGLDRLVQGCGDGADPVRLLPGTAAAREAAVRGEAPAVLSRLAAADDLAAGRLHEVPIAGTDGARELRAVWSAEVAPTAAARSLLRIATGGRIR